MEFKRILEQIIGDFENREIRYGLIGGFALIVMNIPKTTADIDFLVHKEDMDILDKIMKGLGYKLSYRSKNVSQFIGQRKSLGEIDIIHAFRRHSLQMLKRAVIKDFKGLKIKVIAPTDIVGLKIQAIANNQDRYNKELADIQDIVKNNPEEIDWQLAKEYFELFNLGKEFKQLHKKYG